VNSDVRRKKPLFREITKSWKSWTGIGLAIIHALILIGGIAAKAPLPPPKPCLPDEICLDPWNSNFAGVSIIAGRSFHLAYEALLTQFLVLVDIPGILVGAVVLWLPLNILNLPKLTESYIAGMIWLIFGSLQWWLIGTMVEIKLKRRLFFRGSSA
jgi:hypothetical protein